MTDRHGKGGGVRLTMLSDMAGRDLAESLPKLRAWGLDLLDLKGGLFGKGVLDLTDDEAARAASMLRDAGVEVYCLSTQLFHSQVEIGEAAFRAKYAGGVDRAIQLAEVLQPRFIRLLAADTSRRAELDDAVAYIAAEQPWVFDAYREAAERIAAAGFETTIENEIGGCIFSRPEEVVAFFDALGRPDRTCFTWDVQNLWQMGTFPSVEVYEALQPVTGYVHVKGGIAGADGGLEFRSTLRDASWPVEEIVGRVAASGVSPVVCLNWPHGGTRPGRENEDIIAEDLAYVRELLTESRT